MADSSLSEGPGDAGPSPSVSEHQPSSREIVGNILAHSVSQATITSAIMINMLTIVFEADAEAQDKDPAAWVSIVGAICLVLYLIELAARLYVRRLKFFYGTINLIDFAVVMNDLFLLIFAMAVDSSDMPAFLTCLRIIRLARLARAHRILQFFPMLAGMCRDLLGAMQAVIYGFFLLSIVLTFWSVVSVQLIHPLVKDLVAEGVFDGCERCPRAFSSVMHSNLTYLQTILAGDAWGQMAIPIIEAHPWTVCLFLAVLISITLAIMNVILALIVESAEETRKSDLAERMKLKEKEFLSKSKKLLNLCRDMDSDQSGSLSLEELLIGFETNEELVPILHDMGIGKEDVASLFQLMDNDDSGGVDYKEFVAFLHRMKTCDEITLLTFIRHFVTEIYTLVRDTPEKKQANAQVRRSLAVLDRAAASTGTATYDGRPSPVSVQQIRKSVRLSSADVVNPESKKSMHTSASQLSKTMSFSRSDQAQHTTESESATDSALVLAKMLDIHDDIEDLSSSVKKEFAKCNEDFVTLTSQLCQILDVCNSIDKKPTAFDSQLCQISDVCNAIDKKSPNLVPSAVDQIHTSMRSNDAEKLLAEPRQRAQFLCPPLSKFGGGGDIVEPMREDSFFTSSAI